MRSSNQRGEGKLKLIAITAVLALIVLSAFRIVPPFVKGFDMKDFIRNQAKFYRVDRPTPEEVQTVIYRKAQELDLPVERGQIRVRPAKDGIEIDVTYSMEMDLFVYQWTRTWQLHADSASAF